MIIYPAIDMRGGKVVRLVGGKAEHETIYGYDPVVTAKKWLDAGAEWVHMVNLDGAFDAVSDNSTVLEKVAESGIKIQFGGGLRSLDAVEKALNRGVTRAVIGTLAVNNPAIVEEAIQRFGAEAICIALDARDGKITTHGWTQVSEQTPTQFGRMIQEKGVRYALYTDVRRDGSMIGVNIQDTIALARATGLQVIASGGVSHMNEIHQLARSQVVQGVIIGKALYENKISLQEALMATKGYK